MYEYIKGTVAEVAPAYAVIDVGGVGYYLHISLETYSAIEHETETRLYVHYVVREDAQLLYGFSTKAERELFRLLISVSGVGGNTARMILSTYSPRELQGIITAGNAVLLKNVKGLGLKTAQKIIVELSGKLMAPGADDGGAQPGAGGSFDEALAALSMVGCPRAPAEKDLRGGLGADPNGVEKALNPPFRKCGYAACVVGNRKLLENRSESLPAFCFGSIFVLYLHRLTKRLILIRLYGRHSAWIHFDSVRLLCRGYCADSHRYRVEAAQVAAA